MKRVLLVKPFERITNNHSLSQSQKQTQDIYIYEEENGMTIIYVKGTCKNSQ